MGRELEYFGVRGPTWCIRVRIPSSSQIGADMKRVIVVLFAAVTSLWSGSAFAHHSFAATYFEKETVSVEGDLVQFEFRNPHSFVQLEAKDADGNVTRWTIEWAAPNQLAGRGITRETLRPGDHVIVTGNPGRNPADHRIRMLTLLRPKDNFGWGQSPDEVVH